MNEQRQIQVGLARLYVKDISFESPKAPAIFTQQVQPELKVDVGVRPKQVQENLWEVTLKLTIEAKAKNETAFLVEVEQCGLFEIRNANQQEIQNILGVFCPTTIFPYARQTVDSLMLQGGFPPLMLAPINFEMLQQQAANQPKQ